MKSRRNFLKKSFWIIPALALPRISLGIPVRTLPKVLILGDSISIGVQNINRWTGDTEWDLIHFNFGLHDIKHVDPDTRKNSKDPAHPLQADLKQYIKNLEKIVEKLKTTGAKLVFATTTPYPDDVDGPLRDPGMPEKYNKVAQKIMKKQRIMINDLYAFVLPRMADLQRPNNVHFTEFGSKALAGQVAEVISDNL